MSSEKSADAEMEDAPIENEEVGDDNESSEGEEESDPSEASAAKSPLKSNAENRKLLKQQQKEDRARAKKLEEQRKGAIESIRNKQNAAIDDEMAKDKAKRFKFLMAQTEIFTHFLTGVPEDKSAKKKETAGNRRQRMTEEEEDKQMLTEANAVGTRLTVQPSCIKFGTMKDYQLEGLNWLIRLFENGINGILADEMGLGKTLQTISLLGYLKEYRGDNGPHLIVVPKSTLGNWINEINRWCPSLRAFKLHGDKATRASIISSKLIAGKFDICVTSYEVAIIEKSSLGKFSWRYLVIDEAHRVKNENSKLSQILRVLNSRNRLLVTGTPLQNNLHELWALLNFLLPDVFSDSEKFDEWFDLSSGNQQSVVDQLHKILRPFLLRRLKTDVEASLLPKKEVLLFVGMSDMQRQWYKNLLKKDSDALNGTEKTSSKTRLQNIMMQLRKCTNHPYLFQGAEPGPPFTTDQHLVDNSAKLRVLDMLLPKLQAQDSRVLIFSQMTRMLDILEDYCVWKGHQYCRIDGSTGGDLRDSQIEDFNVPGSEKFIFLLSTRAGGLGINLATADTVVIYDSDWNPQVDLQAMDRAHRIGQKKIVHVYRFVTENSIEEKIVERANAKLHLDAMVIQQGRLSEQNKALSKKEILGMIKYGADVIFGGKDTLVTEEDIDLLIERGERKTHELSEKFQENTKTLLSNFSMDQAYDNLYEFEGVNYRDGDDKALKDLHKQHSFIDFGKRERKGPDSYNVTEYYKETLRPDAPPKQRAPRPPKQPTVHEFQFAPHRLRILLERELWAFRIDVDPNLVNTHVAEKMADGSPEEREAEAERLRAIAVPLTDEEKEERNSLLTEGFHTWNKRDFINFTKACERHGRDSVEDIAQDVGKELEEVQNYSKVFFKRGPQELSDWAKIIANIQRGESKIQRVDEIKAAIAAKVARSGRNPWQTLTINYQGTKGKAFTEEEDRFLVNCVNQLGYNRFEEVKMEIRKAWEFRFDWFFKSRSAVELQRRCDTLVRLIEKEAEDLKSRKKSKKAKGSTKKGKTKPASKKSKKGGVKRKASTGPAKSKKKAKTEKGAVVTATDDGEDAGE